MAKTDYPDVDAYIASQPETARPVLSQVRAAIRKALPDAEEVISYQIPAYRRAKGGMILFFAGWKAHYSIYPATPELLEALGDEIAAVGKVQKDTLRFPLDKPVPVDLIARIAAFKAAEAATRAKAKVSAKKKA